MNQNQQLGRATGSTGVDNSSGKVSAQSSLTDLTVAPTDFSRRSSSEQRHSVELYIDEVVLHGLEPAQRYAIGDAVELELTRLFSDQGAPATIMYGREIADLDGTAIEISTGASAEVIGRQLARAIYKGLGQ